MSKKSSSARKKGREKEATAKAAESRGSLGTKRQCAACYTKFYDFDKAEIQCPKCDGIIDPNAQVVVRRVEPKRSTPSRSIDSLDDEGDVVIADAGGVDSDDLEDTDVGVEISVEDDG